MVVKLIKWPLSSRKFEVRLVIKRLEGLDDEMSQMLLRSEIKWKGLKKKKMLGFGSLKGVKRDQTSVGVFDDVNGAFCWNEEFRNFCSFLGFKDCGLQSWEVVISVVNGSSQDLKNKALVVGKALLNLGEYVLSSQVKDLDISVPLTLADGRKGSNPLLMMSLSLIEVKYAASELVSGSAGIMPSSRELSLSPEKERVNNQRKDRKKVNIFKGCVTAPKFDMTHLEDDNGNELSDNKRSDFDTDSVDDMNEDGISDEGEEQINMLQPLSYGPLTYVNFGHSSYTGEVDDWIYYSNRKPHVETSPAEDSTTATSVQVLSMQQIPKHRFLSWRKRKLGFRSTKPKGEPLLKKDCRDEGGDDIDFDRRQLTSSDESSYGWRKTEDGSTTSRSSFSEFEDDEFLVGVWEKKVFTCRDGLMKLETEVFFASMDQRSERAGGESACTSLVAVIAEWLQSNSFEMPIKSQFDRLIRDGSSEWRNMCETQVFRERFPDKHFDLETVLEAKIRPLSIVPEKSYVGFFHPEGLTEESCFDSLRGSMSFDEIWDEISRQASECDLRSHPLVYIVSWNDHFFILKVEQDAYYIIDTLGERLFEGCSQAYILKFDHDTIIKQMPANAEAQGNTRPQQVLRSEKPDNKVEETSGCGASPACATAEESLVSSGKESCKEYIKSFLAAIPVRQLEADIKKGLSSSSIRLHQRLQIEFHFTDIMS